MTNAAVRRLALRWGLAFGIAFSSCVAQEKSALAPQADALEQRSQNPDLLSFDELVVLASTARPEGVLSERLAALLNTPFLHNESPPADIPPRRPGVTGLGAVLRVGLWNIERGLNFELIQSSLTDSSQFLRIAKTQDRISPRQRAIVESQLATLQGVDVLVLNEADWGHETDRI